MSHWQDYSDQLFRDTALGFSLDLSRMDIAPWFRRAMQPAIERAFRDRDDLENGALANPDEKRRVGHYWLRNPAIAPDEEIRNAITAPLEALKAFAAKIHSGEISPPGGGRFERILLIGIGGSALGPQLVSDALGGGNPVMPVHFFDNTDPEGIDRVLGSLGTTALATTLVLVISKSGGTPETRNGMLEAATAWKAAGLDFGAHAVAITGKGSKLDEFAARNGFIARLPMEDWIGGRTSVMSTVGLVPAALQGFDVDAMLEGAAAMDELSRRDNPDTNPAMLMALAWHHACKGRGEKDMVVIPYKDSLGLLAKYLQQLVMESLGKEKDLCGTLVHQGISVYGNKGSTDQHAYIQQLRDGIPNFFAVLIEVRRSRRGPSIEVEPGITSGDYLQGFLRGTRAALHHSGRPSLTISIPVVDAFQLGLLIALFERTVSFYGSLVNINPYHQPGVEAGKKAATRFLDLLRAVRARLGPEPATAEQIAAAVGQDPEDVHHCLVHLAANDNATCTPGDTPADDLFLAL